MAVNFKVPQFSTENPKLWFAQVEAQFLTFQVTTERAKFDLLIPLLGTCIAAEVQDTVVNPLANTPYSDLKATLIKCFAKSEDARITQLLDRERLVDRTPLQHLRHPRSLVPGIDKALSLKHLSAPQHLTSSHESGDHMVERISLKPQAAAATATSSSSTPEHGEIAALHREIAQLAYQVKKLPMNRGRSRSCTRSRSRVSKKFDVC
ncbi:uncharacterized protein LOC106693953 [Microplitis demolitor]|uniref:uncharacterized protein LOC106693953 n=1 Tax=Microplitis demolitor TaxID=69319 RepID=UPI0006D51B80|nr:uncharacterized protein LOC106693953 [Microplitis demolitor]